MMMFVRDDLDFDLWADDEPDQLEEEEAVAPPPGDATATTGTVKWFDRSKGYGFIVPQDGGGDILVHEKCLQVLGRAGLQGGERVSVIYAYGSYGRYARSVRELPCSGPNRTIGDLPPPPAERDREGRGERPLQPARVKWFDRKRGFGFVTVFGRSEDVFLHMQTVRRCGLAELAEGEAVAVRMTEGPRGFMVSDLRLWDAGSA